MINILNIKIEGFGSIRDPLEFPFNSLGVNIIRGKNGSGKSTIFNAMVWGLYGTNLKGVTSKKLVTKKPFRTSDFQGTRVVIDLEINGDLYFIARHISFKGDTLGIKGNSSLLVWKNDELVNTQHVADSQKYILELLKLPLKTFLSSILFGQRMKRFIEGSPAEKREIFESIIDLLFVDKARVKAKDSQDELEALIEKSNQDILLAKADTENIQSLIKSHKETLANFESLKQKQILEINGNISNIQERTLEYVLEEVPELKKIDESLLPNYRNCESELQQIMRGRDRLNPPANPTSICNHCGQSIDASIMAELQKQYKNHLEEYEEKLIEYNVNIEKHNVELKELKSRLVAQEVLEKFNNEVASLVGRNHLRETNLKTLETQRLNWKSQLETVKAQQLPSIDLDSKTQKIQSNKLLIQNSISTIDQINKTLEVVKWWASTGFTSKGLKGHMLNSALSLLNEAIFKYSSRLGFNISFAIDTTRASKPFTTKCFLQDIELDYNEFSGGEKAKVDVATAFAIHDLVSSSIGFNILIMDEVFEGLDIEGIEDVFDLIRLKAQEKMLYIITHSDQIDSLNTKRIDIIKINNTTKLK